MASQLLGLLNPEAPREFPIKVLGQVIAILKNRADSFGDRNLQLKQVGRRTSRKIENEVTVSDSQFEICSMSFV